MKASITGKTVGFRDKFRELGETCISYTATLDLRPGLTSPNMCFVQNIADIRSRHDGAGRGEGGGGGGGHHVMVNII